MDASTRRILTEYVSDTEQKLEFYDDLLNRLELFSDILNSRFQYKKMTIDRQAGFVFQDSQGHELNLEALSSGEQHELILVYDLLFSTRKNTLLLIDEPELSLHIAWQRKFIPDLKRIIELSPMDVVLSTHSPQLIGSFMDLAVQLRGPDGKQNGE